MLLQYGQIVGRVDMGGLMTEWKDFPSYSFDFVTGCDRGVQILVRPLKDKLHQKTLHCSSYTCDGLPCKAIDQSAYFCGTHTLTDISCSVR